MTKYERWPKADWQYDIANGDTELGYEAWVDHNEESEVKGGIMNRFIVTIRVDVEVPEGDDPTLEARKMIIESKWGYDYEVEEIGSVEEAS